MSKSPPATKALEAAGAAFTVHTYDYDPDAERIALHAAEALGEDPARVLKTLMVLLDGKPACAVIPSDKEAAMKKLAMALGGKHAEMMKPAEAERVTGYKVGGISAFGQRRKVPWRSRRRRWRSRMFISTAASADCRYGSIRRKRSGRWRQSRRRSRHKLAPI